MENWQTLRAGVINFWYYDDESFHFENGRLLLRGANGSGKSVTMQSLIPLLFDGNKSPERLDPFGSKARKMESYLLSDGLDLDERTGYLYLEFTKPESERYLTIGMGMRARKGKAMDTWYFIITDNRRLGNDYDLSLYKDIGQKIPLTQKELTNRIADGGHLYTKQREYKAAVNDHLFGYADLSDFDELIKLLIQIRSPKLSKEFNPTTMYEIMQNSLFTLTEEDLRPMSESIESMDEVKLKIDALKRSKKAMERINNPYEKYNQYLLSYKADAYVNLDTEVEVMDKEQGKREKKYASLEKDLNQVTLDINSLEEEEQSLKAQESRLKDHDLSRLAEEKIEVLKAKETSEQRVGDLENRKEKKSEAERDLNSKKEDLLNKQYEVEKAIDDHLEELATYSELPLFDEHGFFSDEYKKSEETFDFSSHKRQLKNYMDKVKVGLDGLRVMKVLHDKYEDLNLEKDQTQKDLEKQERFLLETENQLGGIREEFAENAHAWRKNNLVFVPEDKAMHQMTERVFQYGEVYRFDQCIDPVQNELFKLKTAIGTEISSKNASKESLNDDLFQKQAELRDLKALKDPEPERDEAVRMNRVRLDELKIPYMPLYQALDFEGDLDEGMKGKVEEALLEMGLLDALIVDVKYREKALAMEEGQADKYLFAKPQILRHNLCNFLKVDRHSDQSFTLLVKEVIESILIDETEEGFYISDNGEYGNSILKGKVSGNYQSKFISFLSRKRYKEEKIEAVKDEINLLKERIQGIDEGLQALSQRLDDAEKEWQSFPDETDLRLAYGELKDAESYKDLLQRLRNEITEKVDLAHKELNDKKREIHELTNDLYLSRTVEAYSEAIDELNLYKDALQRMIGEDQTLRHVKENIVSVDDQLESIVAELDQYIYDLNLEEKNFRTLNVKLDQIESQLSVGDYREIVENLEKIDKRLGEIPNVRTVLYKNMSTLDANMIQLKDQMTSFESRRQSVDSRLSLYKWAFEKEWNLGYVSMDHEDGNILEIAKALINVYGTVLEEERTINDLQNDLVQKFMLEQSDLIEYNMKQQYLFRYLPFDEISKEDLMYIQRLDIQARTHGKTVSFFELIQLITEQINTQQNILDERDRELFEEILINTVSKKISSKIYHSEQWVKEIDRLMEGMNTSSGLTFNIRWVTKKAASEDQLSTKELVGMLRGDQSLLTRKQRDKMIDHFRSKIQESKNRMGDADDQRSFLAIMKDVLDYRKWFDFQLYYTKKGEAKKELTNNAFFTFSGGEKAMAMYVPLFSAVYAKYQSGAKDCPRVISLDEAFAGVDEKNIKDMFKLLVRLELNFVANSQVLFGDYETVPELGIYELIRPENVTFVTLIRYYWNGRERTIVSEA